MSPLYLEFEQTLAWHCAPSLAGIKPADLISWRPPQQEGMPMLGHYAGALARRGIRLRVLGCRGERLLLLIFRPGRLEACLKTGAVEAMLAQAGYPVGGTVDEMLSHLSRRLARGEDFPHEIGLFLGYPPEDVEGFRRHEGRNCKLSGLWKVYGDVEQARKRFEDYHRCRRALKRRLEAGHCLEDIFPAA